MSQAIIGRWGRNLAVRFSAGDAQAAGFAEGERVEIIPQNGEVVIRKAAPKLTAADLFRGKSPEEWRALYAGIYEWGPDVGREIVEE